jgi:hypothetical protein
MRFNDTRASPPFTLPAKIKQCVIAAHEADDAAGWISPSYYPHRNRNNNDTTKGIPFLPFRTTADETRISTLLLREGAAANLGVDDCDTFWRTGSARHESAVELYFARQTVSQLKITYRQNFADGVELWNCPKQCAFLVQLDDHTWEEICVFEIDGSRLCEGSLVLDYKVKFTKVTGSLFKFIVRSTYAGETANAPPKGGVLGWAKSLVTTDIFTGSGAEIVHICIR